MIRQSFFNGTAYLGIPLNEKFRKLAFEGIERYGINYGASRNNATAPDIYRIAEVEAAKRFGAGDAIIVSSGYLAAQLVIQNHIGYKFIYAPDTHPALWIGAPTPPLISYNEWVEQTVLVINNSELPVLIITNSLNNLYPQIYSFEWLTQIDTGKEVSLLIDDSHGVGICGTSGGGIYSVIPGSANIRVIVVASMAKALGVDAGLILGEKTTISFLRDSIIYAGASPPSPGLMYAYVMGEGIYLSELQQLRSNMKIFNEFIAEIDHLAYVQDFPVYLIDDPLAGNYLHSKGVTISSFAYPDPTGKILNRIVLSSVHTPDELRYLATMLKMMFDY